MPKPHGIAPSRPTHGTTSPWEHRLDALHTEIARGNANEGAPDDQQRTSGVARILGSLRSADGKGIVRIEDRYDTDIDDLWSALTDPGRLARWYGQVEGDLRPAESSAYTSNPMAGTAPGAWKRASPHGGCW